MALDCGLAVAFLLRVLAAFVSDYWRTARASRLKEAEIRFSNDRQLPKMKNAMQSKRLIDANEKSATGTTLGTVLTPPVYASWETIQAASPLKLKRQRRAKTH